MSSVSTLIIFLVLIQACSTTKETSKNTEATKSQNGTITENDTIPEPPPPPVSELGPGQAKISGHVAALKESVLYLQVESIHEYGSATPPIAAYDTLSVQVASNTMFKRESKIVLIIQHNISSDSSEKTAWSFVKLAN